MLDRNAGTLSLQIEADQIAQVAKALAHPARIRIITFLLSKPGCIGGDIVDQVGLAQSTVSEHLRILKDAGIVTGTIAYPRVCYSRRHSRRSAISSRPSPRARRQARRRAATPPKAAFQRRPQHDHPHRL